MIQILLVVTLGALLSVATGMQSQTLFGFPLVYYCTALVMLVQWLAFIPAYLYQTEKYYDLTGTASYWLVILFLLICSYFGDVTLDSRDMLLAALTLIWSLRLGYFLFMRALQEGGDSRFDSIKPVFNKFLLAWTLQGLWVLVTAAAVITVLSSQQHTPLTVWDMPVIVVWFIAFGIEVFADHQKTMHHKTFGKSRFIETGLWRYCRHPNYFGEIVMWFTIAILAWPVLSGWSYVALISPIFVYWLITHVSGIPMLEKSADQRWGKQADYIRYKSTTPRLIPQIKRIIQS